MYLVYDLETYPDTCVENTAADGEFPSIPCHRIVSIGSVRLNAALSPESYSAPVFETHEEEEAGLETFLEQAAPNILVDWNGNRFDVPVLKNRAFRYGIPTEFMYKYEFTARYAAKRHIDLKDLWTSFNSYTTHLADVAQLMGLPGKDGMDGSKVKDLFGVDNEKISTYCAQDALQTAMIFVRWRFVSGVISKMLYVKSMKEFKKLMLADERMIGFCEKIDWNRVYS